MPRRNVSRHIEISPHAELLIMIFLGMVRGVMNWLSFAWDGNVQEVWNLPGPSPSFSAEYHFDYWLKTILSFVVLFRNFATPLHLLFYVIMLYPVLTGEQHCLMLPWLHLQMLKNIVADVICTVIGVLLCWMLHSCGLLTLEFLVVRIISMRNSKDLIHFLIGITISEFLVPSIYLWRRLRSYYFDLYYAELDGEYSFPAFKQDTSLTLAQRRRAAKSLDGTMTGLISPNEGARVNSCLTYEEFFGPEEWNVDQDKKISRSLTTLLTNESQESDEIEEDSSLQIIDDANLTPAQKTMRILGITMENSDLATHQIHKITSTTDVTKSTADTSESSPDVELNSSFVPVTRESNEPGVVATQVHFSPGSKNAVKKLLDKCPCCEESKCSENDDEDSDSGRIEPIGRTVAVSRSPPLAKKPSDTDLDRTSREEPSNCCNRNREGESKGRELQDGNREINEVGVIAVGTYREDRVEPSTVSTSFGYHKKDLYPIPRLQAIVERDGIAWENLKEINFVSVIDKVLCDEFKLFKLRKNYRNGENSDKGLTKNLRNLSEDSHVRAADIKRVPANIDCKKEKVEYEGSRSPGEILPQRGDGTQFAHNSLELCLTETNASYVPTSASFGVGSDILTLNASCVFDETQISGIQSFDSTSVPTNSLARLHQNIGSHSHFQSSFEEHSNMFNDSKAEFLPLQYSAHSSIYGTVPVVDECLRYYQMDQISAEKGIVDKNSMIGNSLYDSSRSSRPGMVTKESKSTCGPVYYQSTNHTRQFQPGHYDRSEEVSPKNETSCTRSEKPRDLIFGSQDCIDYQQNRLISDERVQLVSSLVDAEEIFPSSSTRLTLDGHKSTSVSRTATLTNVSVSNYETLVRNVQTSNYTSVGLHPNFAPERSVKTGEKQALFAAVNQPFTGEKPPPKLIQLTSSSRSSRSSRGKKTSEKWEGKTLQALKAYNEKTLHKYKREMDARNHSNVTNISSSFSRQEENQFLDHRIGSSFSTQQSGPSCLDQNDTGPPSLSGSIYGSNSNQALYVPSAPELDTPEKELISNIEKAYARFTRSKPVGPVTIGARYQSTAAKEFFDLYSGGRGRLRKELQRIKIGGEITGRKQHSKYSKLSRETNQCDITSRSCKRIEGSQKGRDLNRTLAKENIIARDIEVYFLERQTNDEPSPSENLPITTIKSFSRKRGDDTSSVVSSGTLTPDNSQSPMIDVLENSEDIPCRIEDNEYYRQLRKNNVSENVREVMKNIDWSFRRPHCTESRHSEQKERNETIVSADHRLEYQNIKQKTTEIMLQNAFANSENSERGFHLGESEYEYYPIFNDIAVAMGEIVKAAAFRGNRNEFISQPATEIEVPGIDDENPYGPSDLHSKLPRRSSPREFFTSSTIAKNTQVLNEYSIAKELPSMILNAENEVSSLLSRLHVSPESRSAVAKGLTEPEDTAEEQENADGNVTSIQTNNLKGYSKYLFKGSSTPKRSPKSSSCYNSDRSQHVGSENQINCERLKLALEDVIHKVPLAIRESSLKIPRFFDNEEPQYELVFKLCQRILDHFHAGGNEVQSTIAKVLNEFPPCETLIQNESSSSPLKVILDEGLPKSLGSSEFIAGLEMLNVLNLITTTTGKMINLTENHGGAEASPTCSIEFLSRELNDRFERQYSPEEAMSQLGTSGMLNFDYVNANASVQSDELGFNSEQMSLNDSAKHRSHIKFESRPNSRFSSLDKIDEPRNEDESKFLLSGNLTVDHSVSPTNLELLNRERFKREAIDSVFVRVIRERQSSNQLLARTEVERFGSQTNDTMEQGNFSPTNNENFNASALQNVLNTERETNINRLRGEYLIDGNDVPSDLVIGDIETMESLIGNIKTVFKQFVAEDGRQKEQIEKVKRTVEMQKKLSSLTNLTFIVHGKVQKLQRLVEIVTNYATVTGCSSELVSSSGTVRSPSAVKSSYEVNNSDMRKRELTTVRSTEKSGSFKNVPKGPVKDRKKSNNDDHQAVQTCRSSKDPRDSIDRFASWDKMIPPSTRRLIARSRRKMKPKKTAAVSEPPRRILKVIKLINENDSDFFSARSVPQRGKGLSSGYLMDSDSDGNFTVSRPPSPISILSETSQTLSCDNEDSDVLLNESVKVSEAVATSEIIESSWYSPSAIFTKDLTRDLTNFENDMKSKVSKSNDDIESLKNQRSLKNSSNLLSMSSEVFSRAKAFPDVIDGDDDENIQNDGKLHVLSREILLTDWPSRNISPADAVRIVSELTNEVQQILIHRFRGVNCLTNGLPAALKHGSLIPLSDDRKTDSLIDIRQSTSCDMRDDVAEQNQIKEGGENRVKEILRDLIAELIVDCEGYDAISEVLQRESIISLKHVGTGAEYGAAVVKKITEVFSTNDFMENNVIRARGSQNSEVERVANQNDVEVEKNKSLMAEENSISGVQLSQLVDSRKRAIIDVGFSMEEGIATTSDSSRQVSSVNDVSSDIVISELSYKNVVGNDRVLNLNFASYDSYESLMSQKRNETSESSSRVISLSDHTFLEEFPDKIVNYSNKSFSQSRELFEKRSSELIQSNSQHDAKETGSEERSSDNNSRITSFTSISSESNTQHKKRGSADAKRDT